jgi:hypothetical protein
MTTTNAILTAVLRVHSERTILVVLGALTASLLILAYITLVMPNASYVEIYLNDVIGLTDAAYRTYRGQIPSIDFLSLYGAAIYYPSALGFYFDFNAGAVLGFGHFLTAVPLLIMAALASYRRFPILHSVILLLFLFLLIVVPMRLGGMVHELTYGIYYTRHGWAALTIALLFYLEPRTLRRSDLFLDSIVLSLLLLYLFYTKITFAAVALAFVIINSMTSKYKLRLSIISLSIFVSVVAAILIFTEYNSAYFNDIFGTVSRNPALRRGLWELFLIVSEHLGIFVLCFAALTAAYLTGRRSFFDLAFVTGCIIASLMLLDQSGGTERGLPALIVVFLICGELARRTECRIKEGTAASSWPGYVASISIVGMLLAFASEPMVRGGLALHSHFNKTTGEQAAAAMNLSGILVGDPSFDVHEALGHDDAAHALFNYHRGPRWQLRDWEYLRLIAEGVKLLESVPHDNHSVINFEHTNPFSVLLGMRPTEYGYPLFWAEKYKNRKEAISRYFPPERYFSDADYVMVPEIPYVRRQLETLMEVYGAYLEENFHELKRSTHWRLYARF